MGDGAGEREPGKDVLKKDSVPRSKSGYLPSLDGWRAIAVLGVMFTHDYNHHLGRWKLDFLHNFGGYGVILFFAISGVLITTRILEEEAVRGRVNLRGFYIRRVLRIQPAAIVYLAIAALVVPFGLTLDGGWKYWLASLLFFRNYMPHDVGPFSYFAAGHFWTLAVEEHFYLLLSLLLYFFRRNRIVIFGLLAIAAFELPRLLYHHHLFNPATGARTTQYNLWFLMWPAFLAVLLRNSWWRHFSIRYLHPGAVALVFFAVSILCCNISVLRASLYLKAFVVTFPILLIATMMHPASWTTRFLELGAIRFIGRISYSLYIWHVVFFVCRWSPDASDPNHTPHWFTHAPWNYLPAFACAMLSFYFVEKPMMRLGHRLAPPATPGRSDLIETPTAATVAAVGT